MRHIEQGAPADILASADLEWMDYGLKNKLINPSTRINLLGNRPDAEDAVQDAFVRAAERLGCVGAAALPAAEFLRREQELVFDWAERRRGRDLHH